MGEFVEQCSFFRVIAPRIMGLPKFRTEIDSVTVLVVWVDKCESVYTSDTRASVLFVLDRDILLKSREHFFTASYEIAIGSKSLDRFIVDID